MNRQSHQVRCSIFWMCRTVASAVRRSMCAAVMKVLEQNQLTNALGRGARRRRASPRRRRAPTGSDQNSLYGKSWGVTLPLNTPPFAPSSCLWSDPVGAWRRQAKALRHCAPQHSIARNMQSRECMRMLEILRVLLYACVCLCARRRLSLDVHSLVSPTLNIWGCISLCGHNFVTRPTQLVDTSL